MRFASVFAVAAVLAGCALPAARVQQYYITPAFDGAGAERLLLPGTNQIKGSALMRQQGGGVVTCAGRPVFLIPSTEYAKDRLRLLYDSADDRRFTRRGNADVEFIPNPPEYLSTVKTTLCDAQGFFAFDKVANGEFFVQTSVSWVIAGREQGGYLLHRVRVQNSEIASLVLAQ